MKIFFKYLAALFILTFGILALINNGLAVPQATSTASNFSQLFLAVTLNQQNLQEIKLFLSEQGNLLIDQQTLQSWHVKLPSTAPINYQGQNYFFLKDLPGTSYQLNTSTLTVSIQIPASLFENSSFNLADNNSPKATPPSPGGFINYDIVPQISDGQHSTSGLFQTDFFNQYGVLDNSVVANQGVPDQQHLIRLNTTWTTDEPQDMRSFRLGDAFDTPGSWGQSVAFGGVQFATNFATQPSFVTLPLPTIRGQAALPSNVDLYINNALASKQQVSSGPFTINNIPTITGSGQINLVTTDLLGRQQVTTLPFYTSSQLLKPGLQDYSYEAGFIRENYGIVSNDYGPFMITGTDRVGVTNNFTGEVHGELLGAQQTAGVSGSWIVPLGSFTGVWTNSLAASHDQHGVGGLIATGYQHQGQHVSFGASSEYTTVRFMQLGLQDGELSPAWQNQAFIGFPLHYKGASVNFSYIQQINRSTSNVNLASATYSQSVTSNLFMSLNGYTNIGGQNSKAVYLSFTWNIDSNIYATASATGQSNNNQGTLELTRNLPLGNGYGYDIQATGGENPNQQASFSLQRNYGTYTVEAARQNNETGYRLDASGGIVFLNDQVYLSRSIDNSFAVVEVPGFKGVNVYEDNQLIGQTNAHGDLLLTDLRPYDTNPINIDANSLPLTAQLGQTSATVVPYYHAGNVIRFSAQQSHSGLLTIVLTSGQPLPADATVTLQNDPTHTEFPVGENGQVYITGLQANNILVVNWNSQTCKIAVPLVSSVSPIVNLGIFTCEISQ